MPNRPRCMALNAAGHQCANRAKRDHDYCGAHSGNIGRPTKLTRDLADHIADKVRGGRFWEQAAGAAGIDRSTLYRWREQGEADHEHGRDTPHAYFRDALTRASDEAEGAAADAVHAARFTDWKAAAWYLERRNIKVWGKTERVEHSGTVSTPVVVVAPNSAQAAEQVARIIAGAAPHLITNSDDA